MVGQTIHLNNDSWQIVGIMPPHLTQPFTQVQVWVPRVFEVAGLTHNQIDAGAGYSQPIARLKDGVSVEQAQAELNALTQGYKLENTRRLDGTSLTIARDFTDSIVGTLKPTFYALLGAVAFVLLIACANVASLFVGRLSGRQKEIAVRQSLGATRGAVVTELLTESLLVATIAGLIGAGLSVSALRGIAILAVQQLPSNTQFNLNWRAWLFLVSVAFVEPRLLVGLVPATIGPPAPTSWPSSGDATRGSSGVCEGRLGSAPRSSWPRSRSRWCCSSTRASSSRASSHSSGRRQGLIRPAWRRRSSASRPGGIRPGSSRATSSHGWWTSFGGTRPLRTRPPVSRFRSPASVSGRPTAWPGARFCRSLSDRSPSFRS